VQDNSQNTKTKKLIDNSDLGIPYTTAFNKAIVNAAKFLLGINKLNDLYGSACRCEGIDFASAVLENLGAKPVLSEDSMQNIPENGAFVLIANHPHGALDGLLFMATVLKKRPDALFLGNFLLSRIEPLKKYFIEVNPFDAKSSRNISGVRRAMAHVEKGSPLIIFPAGEVSTYQRGLSKLQDKQWSRSMMRLVRSVGVPVIPAFIDGGNSLKFHIVGKIHPVFRTMRLPLELLNKRDLAVQIEIGSALLPKRLTGLESIEEYSDYLRTNVYCLRARVAGGDKIAENIPAEVLQDSPTGNYSIGGDEITSEIESLRANYHLFDSGSFEVFCAPSSRIPVLLKEIGRLRELTFREIGEGTNKEIDIDKFDDLYDHLFIWDKEQSRLAGAYRLGYGDQLLDNVGVEGFYTYSLFEFSPKFNDILRQTIELGRSFIVKDYQRKAQPLMCLWKGIFLVLMKKTQYHYLMGPVSISGEYSAASKWLTINFIKANYWDKSLATCVVPRNGVSTIGKTKVNKELLEGVKSPELLDKLICDIDPQKTAMPVLLRRYLSLNGKVLAFNVDPDFNSALDALFLVSLDNIPQQALDMLSKEMPAEEVYARFSSNSVSLSNTVVSRETKNDC